jgi:hypothetical protein
MGGRLMGGQDISSIGSSSRFGSVGDVAGFLKYGEVNSDKPSLSLGLHICFVVILSLFSYLLWPTPGGSGRNYKHKPAKLKAWHKMLSSLAYKTETPPPMNNFPL